MKMLLKLKEYYRKEKEIIAENKEEINSYNRNMLTMVLLILVLCYAVLALLGKAWENYAQLYFLYGASMLCALICLYFLFQVKDMPVHVLVYGMYAIMVLLCIYSSAFLSPGSFSVYVLIFIVMFPVLFLDNALRINGAECIYTLVYIYAIFQYKESSIVFEEMVNVLFYAAIAVVLGAFRRKERFYYYKLKKEKYIAEHRDTITGLPNHKQMKKDLKLQGRQPLALVMLHIEDVLHMSKIYGLQFSDGFLKELGRCLQSPNIADTLTFYCYGGREFIAVAYHDANRGLFQRLAAVHVAVRALSPYEDEDSEEGLRFSIGAAYWSTDTKKLMNHLDQAVRYAMKSGKNRIVIYEDMKEQIEKE